MKRLYVAALAAVLASSGAAIAQAVDANPQSPPDRAGPARGLARADSDHDGIISRAEFLAMAATRFDRMDINHDGKLSGDENGWRGKFAHRGPPPPDADDAAPAGQSRGAAMFDRLDTDANGTLSRAEFAMPTDRHFDRIDANHDGQIDRAEMTAATARRRDHAAGFGGRRHGPGHRPGPGQEFSDGLPPPPPPASGEDQ